MVVAYVAGILGVVSLGCIAADRRDIFVGLWALLVGLLWFFQDAVKLYFQKLKWLDLLKECPCLTGEDAKRVVPKKGKINPWNEFQQSVGGLGLSREQMSSVYDKQKPSFMGMVAQGLFGKGGGDADGQAEGNKWNAFQESAGGLGLSKEQMSACYAALYMKKVDVTVEVVCNEPWDEARFVWQSQDTDEPDCEGSVPISRISATADRKELHVRDDADQQLLVFEMPGPATADAWEESLLVARKKYAASFVVAYASKDAIPARAPETPPPRKRTPAQPDTLTPDRSEEPPRRPPAPPPAPSQPDKSSAKNNPWNDFQQSVGGLGLSREQMRSIYDKQTEWKQAEGNKWNAFKKSAGGLGLSTEQMSACYAALKK
jgi:hypothetical protein